MKQLTILLSLSILLLGQVQAQQAIYEFPSTPCAGGNGTGIQNCSSPCTACIAADNVGMGNDAWRLFGANFNYYGIDVCRASNSATDSYMSTGSWDVDTVSGKWVSVDAIVNGYETELDSMVVIYRTNGPNELCMNVSMLGMSPYSIVSFNSLVFDSNWSKTVFDLTDMPCTTVGLTVFQMRLRALGSAIGELDIDAIRVFGHDCSLSTGVTESAVTNNALVLMTQDGVQVTSDSPSEVVVYDMSGKVVFYTVNWMGTDTIRIGMGLYVVRVGNSIKKIMVP